MRYFITLPWVLLCTLAFAAGEGGVGFGMPRDMVAVPVTLNEVGPYPFVLDFGVARSVITRDVATYLKLPIDPGGASQPLAAVRSFKAADLPAQEVACVVMDLSPFSRRLGTPVAGVLSGRDIAGEFTLDFGRDTVTGNAGEEGRAFKNPDDPRAVSIELPAEGLPTVNVLLNGKHAEKMAIDPAFGGVMSAPEETLQPLGLIGDETPRLTVEGLADDAPKFLGQTQVRLKSMRVGNAELFDPLCQIAPASEPMRLGLGFLSHFRATFDFEKRLLRLDPIAKPPLHDPPIVGYGLAPAEFREGRWSVWVAKGSPAALAGMVSGDVLIEVGGEDASNLAYSALAARLAANEGAALGVTFAHGPDRHEVTLNAAKLL